MAELTPEQFAMQAQRLRLEQIEWEAVNQIGEIKKTCKSHVAMRGRIMWSPHQRQIVTVELDTAYCAICDVDLGWWCPKSPTHWCEYDESDWYGCKWCHEPDERK